MKLSGRYFDGVHSRPYSVEVAFFADRLRIEGVEPPVEVSLEDIVVTERLGQGPRHLQLPEGGKLELPDSDELAERLRGAPVRGAPDFVFALERRWGVAALAAVIAVVTGFLLVRQGVPALASFIAFWVPDEVHGELGRTTLETLDEDVFEPSSLNEATMDRLDAGFASLSEASGLDPAPVLLYRDGGFVGANAFALPAGIVVVTDQLVDLAEDDQEIFAVMAHEIGHVSERHGLRSVLQSLGVGLLVTIALGDFVTLGSAAGALPLLLLQLEYGRGFETEADRYAVALLAETGRDPESLATMLGRLSGSTDASGDEASDSDSDGWLGYLSTHPATEERIRAIREGRP